ncbi:hypothetical protein PFISCL1PPCAC_1740, partial [Pristionchus fissidentatus]
LPTLFSQDRMSDSDEEIEVVYSKLVRKGLTHIKIENDRLRPSLSRRRRSTRIDIVNRNEGRIRKYKHDFSSSNTRFMKRNGGKKKWTSSVRFRVKRRAELLEEYDDEEEMEREEEEMGEEREETGEGEEGDNMEEAEKEIEIIREIPAQFIQYRNNNEEIEDDEITCVYDAREERRINGEKEMEKEREELKKKTTGKGEKYDNGGRKANKSDKYDKRRKFRRERKKKSRKSRDSHQSQETRAFDSNVIRDIALNSNDMDGEENFTISSLYKGHRGLQLKKVENTSFSAVFSPLGAAFDRSIRMWIYTNTGGGTVELATYEGHVKESIKGFEKPSAIAIVKPGSKFAVIDFNGIYLIDLLANKKSVIVKGFNGRVRGLATTSDGNLASIIHESPPSISVFSTSTKNTELCSIAYSVGRGNPSFICSCDELVYTSDLDLNVLSGFSYNYETKNLASISRRDLSDSVNRTSSVITQYMAGVVSDSNHNLLVADARGRKIHLMTPCGSLIQTIPFADGSLPYIAGLALSPTGRVMTVHRREHKVELYDLVPIVSEADLLAKGLRAISYHRK